MRMLGSEAMVLRASSRVRDLETGAVSVFEEDGADAVRGIIRSVLL
jgi:hypothetical protein